MPDSTRRFLETLQAAGKVIKRQQGETQAWIAQCPAHMDNRPSLSIRRVREQTLLFCFAGCQSEDITEALGLGMADLYDNPSGVAYEYRHQGQVVRKVYRSPTKEFAQQVMAKMVTLYSPPGQNLEAAIDAKREVWIPEGEKDADVLASIGLIAVTSPMGAGQWAKADWSQLAGAFVVIVADRDEVGVERARGLYAYLESLGATARIVQSRVGKDAADHVVAGYGVHDFVTIVADPAFEEDVELAIRRTRVNEEAKRRREERVWARTSERFDPMTLGAIHELEHMDPVWAIDSLMERSDRLVLTGGEGRGKSWLLRQIAICSAAGIYPFDVERKMDPRKVFVLDTENTLAQWQRGSEYILSRAMHHGQDPRQNVVVQAGKRLLLTSEQGANQVHKWIDQFKPDILVLGPIYKMVSGSLNDEDDMASLLETLDSFRERDVTLLIEGHAGHTKTNEGDREYRPRGSSAMLGWPEFGLGLRAMNETQAELVQWRGNREQRPWPEFIRRGIGGEMPWMMASAESGD